MTIQYNIITQIKARLIALNQFRVVGLFPLDYSKIAVTNLPACIVYVGNTAIVQTSTGRKLNITSISVVIQTSNRFNRLQLILDLLSTVISTIATNPVYDGQSVVIELIDIESGNILLQLDQLTAGDTNQISQKVITFRLKYWSCNTI